MAEWVVRGTIWIALMAFVAAEAGRARARRHQRQVRWALPIFIVGAALCSAHFLAAFHWHHNWSHTNAVEVTARQTAEVYGIDWGSGLWVNYVFLAAWVAEAIWWGRHPAYAKRAPSVATWALRGFYALVIVNGAVVFTRGLGVVLGTVLVIGLGVVWLVGSMMVDRGRQDSGLS